MLCFMWQCPEQRDWPGKRAELFARQTEFLLPEHFPFNNYLLLNRDLEAELIHGFERFYFYRLEEENFSYYAYVVIRNIIKLESARGAARFQYRKHLERSVSRAAEVGKKGKALISWARWQSTRSYKSDSRFGEF